MTDLDPGARRALGSLSLSLAELVGKHLVAAGKLVDDDPAAALAHARFARSKAGRIGLVREAAGVTAYHAEQWAEALTELRAARRMSGGPGMIAVMADCERALGRPERALDLLRSPEASQLPPAEAIELRIVAAGARRDLGELDAAVVALQGPDLDLKRRQPWSARLFYAYADNLAAAGRGDDAVRWFLNAAEADDEDETDASERASDLADELAGRTPPQRYLPVEEPASSRAESADVADADRSATDRDDTSTTAARVSEPAERASADGADGTTARPTRNRPVLEDPPESESATATEWAPVTTQGSDPRPASAADAEPAAEEPSDPEPSSTESPADESSEKTESPDDAESPERAEAAESDTPDEQGKTGETAAAATAAEESPGAAADDATGTADQTGTAGDR
ncbi:MULTISPECIES: hypothetical protein [Actinoalloteichus]|uniref:Uncharacterized protein n=1 Tax=Actinoalloteichus fjordicus TaxID=1612552 RepID=A0AAC9LE80_9PSEU|nr:MULTISPECIES: hypothetical protein [Actinoalloteichus]APU16338.1 hypothetical protein UA74_21565 [Actinoalloteichus fjordicus]APU22397.1 hypothetical protein UA75_22040 [Actinoalloteichus sp. GBA129-24]